MKLHSILFAVSFACLAGWAHAGDYSLDMSDDSHAGCLAAPWSSHNTCPPGVIVGDIRNHLVDNRPFKYMAVGLAYDTCRISLSKEGRQQFYDALIALLTDPALNKPRKVVAFMSCFNYRPLRSRLKAAANAAKTEAARNRLQTALSLLERWK